MEVEDVVHCLCITKPPCIQVLLDFILLHNCCDLVMTLEYVLVDILGSMNRYANLHIDMAFIAATEIAIIRDNPAIVNGIDPTPSMNLMDTCAVATIGWISISTHDCFIREWLRKSL